MSLNSFLSDRFKIVINVIKQENNYYKINK